MRRRSRRHDLLQDYGLEASTSVRLTARSEQHDSAHMRMRRDDVHLLRSQPGAMSSPVIALFSTRDPRKPVSFRPSETLYVRLPADTDISADTEISDTETTKAEEMDASDKDKREDTEQPHVLQQAEQTKSEKKSHRRRRVQSVWTPLRLVAHHSYVVGMRVSGIVHRAIVRLEFDK